MRDKYYPPVFGEKQFHCARCNVFASQAFHSLYYFTSNSRFNTDAFVSVCVHCSVATFWYNTKLVYPDTSPVELPHPDLPADCAAEYEEARSIFSRSPRAAAALLRLCIQKLMPYLGEKGKNINDDIKSLVSKGLPVLIQQALDYARVVGNNAVHPGEIDLNDTPETAQKLFRMINIIVEDRITRPKEIEALYNSLPQTSLDAIQKRDSGTS